jgi:hypothetical protein
MSSTNTTIGFKAASSAKYMINNNIGEKISRALSISGFMLIVLVTQRVQTNNKVLGREKPFRLSI